MAQRLASAGRRTEGLTKISVIYKGHTSLIHLEGEKQNKPTGQKKISSRKQVAVAIASRVTEMVGLRWVLQPQDFPSVYGLLCPKTTSKLVFLGQSPDVSVQVGTAAFRLPQAFLWGTSDECNSLL